MPLPYSILTIQSPTRRTGRSVHLGPHRQINKLNRHCASIVKITITSQVRRVNILIMFMSVNTIVKRPIIPAIYRNLPTCNRLQRPSSVSITMPLTRRTKSRPKFLGSLMLKATRHISHINSSKGTSIVHGTSNIPHLMRLLMVSMNFHPQHRLIHLPTPFSLYACPPRTIISKSLRLLVQSKGVRVRHPVILTTGLARRIHSNCLTLTIAFPLPLVVNLVTFRPSRHLEGVRIRRQPAPIEPRRRLLHSQLSVIRHRPIPCNVSSMVLMVLTLHPQGHAGRMSRFVHAARSPVLSPLVTRSVHPAVTLYAARYRYNECLPSGYTEGRSQESTRLSGTGRSTTLPHWPYL